MTASDSHSYRAPHGGYTGSPGDIIRFNSGLEVSVFARAKLPTRLGNFEMVAFRNNLDGKDHVAWVHGDVVGKSDVPIRLHSECLTGDVFGSIKCDCRAQLEHAMEEIAQQDCGIVFYLRQEGRGIGLANKIKAYSLQDLGFDTVQANRHIGFDDDLRRYDVAAAMVHLMGMQSVDLMTNNPKKVRGLTEYGVEVAKRIPIETIPTAENLFYLQTKAAKSGHLLHVAQQSDAHADEPVGRD